MKINKYNLDLGCISFRVGLFLLPSAPAISVISLLVSLIIGLLKEKSKIFLDRWNYMFFLAAIIMIINAYLQQFKFESLAVSSLTWDHPPHIGLFN